MTDDLWFSLIFGVFALFFAVCAIIVIGLSIQQMWENHKCKIQNRG